MVISVTDRHKGAWDMVGAATFSENYGYMEKGCDFDGTIEIADRSLD